MDKINLDSLLLFDNVRKDEAVDTAVKIFNEFLYRDYIAYMESEYYAVQRRLLEGAPTAGTTGTYWQDHLCRLIAASENCLSANSGGCGRNPVVDRIAAKEIDCLKQLYNLDWCTVAKRFKDEETSVCCAATGVRGTKRERLHEAMSQEDTEKTLELLTEYYAAYSFGIFEAYDAFIWDGELIGIRNYDHIIFDRLIGYERQKQALIENADFFMRGLKANNVLLYGDKGTGKSSCVKALLNRFSNEKLKMIELSKENINDLYKIMETVSKVNCKFIIFIDDLSFEESEIGYKHFKSVIEGGLEAQPSNVLLHVTSNRRNIIRETWDDMAGASREIHITDGIQERLSLADRFGLTITFVSPTKDEYINIVKGLASQEGIRLPDENIIEEALRWEMRYHSKSGRTARQFINYLSAREGIKQQC